jgi:CubicO group peptidase (beta-lactamase class C family)
VLEQSTGMGVLDYARKKMFDAMGASGIQWSGDTYYNVEATAREYAKFAYLYLNRGNWGGKQLVPAQWVDDSTRQLHDKDPDPDPDVCHDWYYNLWHINLPNRLGSGVDDPNCPTQFCTATTYANLPPDGYFAEGLAGQYVFVIPSADLIVVRLGNDGFSGIEKWDAYTRGLLERILSAIH